MNITAQSQFLLPTNYKFKDAMHKTKAINMLPRP